MKQPLFLLLFLMGLISCTNNVERSESLAKKASNTNEINWLSLEDAQKLNAKAPKKIIVDVYTAWCGPCKMMDRSTFSDPNIIKMVNDNYYAVKFNAESGDPVTFKGKTFSNPNFDAKRSPFKRNYPHELTGALGIRGYPTLVVFDEELNRITNIVGYKSAPQLKQALAAL